jgi:phage-related protein
VKPAIFHAEAKDTIRNFPIAVKGALGKAIWELQKGERLGMPLSKPMPSVGPGVEELRVKDESGAFRAFYYVRSSKGILVFMPSEKSRVRLRHLKSSSAEND